MPDFHALIRSARITAALLLAALAAGCWRPLAVQHEYFAPTNGSVDRIDTEIRHTVSRHRALQAAQRACAGAPEPAVSSPPGPVPGTATAREALAELCAASGRPPVAAYGGVSNAYRRWVEDQVRELPAPSATGAAAAGGL